MKYIITLLIFSIHIHTQAQYVSTFFNSSSIQVDDAMIQDQQGNLYGSHYMGSNIYKIDPMGNASVFKAGLNTPNGMAFDSQGFLYVVDNQGNKVYKLDSTGATVLQMNVPNASGIIKSIDSDTMIVSQYGTHALRKLSPNGVLSTQPIHFGFPLNGPVGLVYGPDSTLYIANFTDRKILKYKNDSLSFLARVPSGSGSNLGFITYAGGMLYGTTFQANKIYEINPNFIDSTRIFAGSVAGNTDGTLQQARFNNPNGILASRGGDSLFISDFATGNIRIISGLLTGIKAQQEKNMNWSLYPNPCRNQLTVEAKSQISKLRIYNLLGEIVHETEGESQNSLSFQLRLRAGTYFVKLELDEKSLTKKLIIID